MIGDFLKKFRSSGYSGKPEEKDAEPKPEGDEENPEQKTRVLSLTDDEMQAFKGSQPGADLACEVHGRMGEDGEFNVLSVSPMDKAAGYGSEQEMAGQVAQRVTPTVQLSPS